MDRGVWRATVYGVTKSRTRPSDEQQHTWNQPVRNLLRPFRTAWCPLSHGVPHAPWWPRVPGARALASTVLAASPFILGLGSLEKEMATHSSVLVWGIPQTEETGRLVHGVAKSWTQPSN